MNLLKNILITLMIFNIYSCTNEYVLSEKQIQGTEYNTALALGYRDLSRLEKEQFDTYSSELFARKGLSALKGDDVPPEEIINWRILDQKDRIDLELGRERLMTVSTFQTRMTYPLKTAYAQVLYDCWMEQQEEDWQPEDIEICKKDFMVAIIDLENAIFGIVEDEIITIDDKEPIINVELPTQIAGRELLGFYTIYFDLDSYALDFEANQIINTIIYDSETHGEFDLALEGHTDSTASYAYNETLSKNRVQAVKKALEQKGLKPNNIIKLESFGETRLKIPTEQEVRERLNRRVEVYIIR